MTAALSEHASRALVSAYLVGIFGLAVVALRGSDPAAFHLTALQWRILNVAMTLGVAVAAVAPVINGAWVVSDRL